MKSADLSLEVLRAASIVERKGLTQQMIAQATGASQSQVSRILGGRCRRRSKAFEAVCKYVHHFDHRVSIGEVRRNTELMQALASTWDGTAAHSHALAAVIRSLHGLALAPPARRATT
jgi:transcriptional regulator with XRE-family HTH domain